MDKVNYAIESLKNIQGLIKFTDQKSGASLIVSGLVLTAYLDSAKDLSFSNLNSITLVGIIVFLSGLSTLITICITIYLSFFKILKPRFARTYLDDEISLYYFEHLAQIGKEMILNKYNEVNEKDMLKYIIEQQYEVSLILSKKTTELNKSFNYLFVSIVSLILFIVSVNIL